MHLGLTRMKPESLVSRWVLAAPSELFNAARGLKIFVDNI